MMFSKLLLLAFAAIFWSVDQPRSGPLDSMYGLGELASLKPQYEKGWNDNFDNVFKPRLTPEEMSRLRRVEFIVPLVAPDREPLGFYAADSKIFASAASIHFLEEIALAWVWLDMNSYETRTVADYLLMLRQWSDQRGRAPSPLQALCIPPFGKAGARVEERAQRVFDSIIAFIMLHESGHVLHQHPGNQAVAAIKSRVHEEQADRFAVDMFQRIREPPVGVSLLFFVMAHFLENRADFATEVAYQQALAVRTHPLSPERLINLASYMAGGSSSFSHGLSPVAKVTVDYISVKILELALLIGDQGVQRLSARIGRSATPQDLAPRRRGRYLAEPCGRPMSGGQTFEGALRGKFADGKSSLDADVILTREGNQVNGSYSFGAGFGRIRGTIAGNNLRYDWNMLEESGSGVLALQDGVYRGRWESRDSFTRGSMELRSAP